MATATGDVTKVQIFDPVLYINGVDMGYLGEVITFTAGFELKEYSAGIPRTLRKAMKIRETAVLKVEQMEVTADNLKRALSLDTSIISNSIVTAGGDSTVPEVTDVKVQGIDDADKKIEVHIFKALVTEIGDIELSEEYLKLPLTLSAIADLTRTKGDQLYRMIREP